MIFNSIELQNFRQYKKPIKIDFANPKDKKSITLIVAANGVGKTTFLQAFRYCFYGKSTNYLNLPKSDVLVNNTLVDDLDELETSDMRVQVEFYHKGIKYLAVREQKFRKFNGRLEPHLNEEFTLNYLTDKDGWKSYNSEESYDKIRSILPDGLSQIFMFDGERMERDLSDPQFSLELKESILGILDIKKYDKLIEVIGTAGNSKSVLGKLRKKLSSPSRAEQEKLNKNNKHLEMRERINLEIEKINEKIELVDDRLELIKSNQAKIEESNSFAKEREQADQKYEEKDDEIYRLSEKYLSLTRNALVYKLMISNKLTYDNFINKGTKNENFFNSLHINTLKDILEKGECICGRPIHEHTDEEQRLHDLMKFALPIESAQHLNLIDQLYKRSVEFEEINEKLKEIKTDIRNAKSEKENYRQDSIRLTQKIAEINKRHGSNIHQDYDKLIERKMSLKVEIGKREKTLSTLNSVISKSEKIISKIENADEKNQKISNVINIMTGIKEELIHYRNEKDKNAREVLEKEFDEILNKTLYGNYKVRIDEKYKITFFDLDTNRDVTSVLSTGQNVVISLTFINALINTARKLSNTIETGEKYGVIMDAALSNLDEKHIDNVCRNNLINLDQLVFLSFKRQLRDEMYKGIKESIGNAYMLRKNKNGYVELERIALTELDDFIHEYEE